MDIEKPIIPNRLLQPFLSESIAHILLNPIDEFPKDKSERDRIESARINWDSSLQHFPEIHESMGITELVKACALEHKFSELPIIFPRFLCGLAAIYRELGLPKLNYTRSIFPRVTDAIKFLNDRENYPCHSMNMTDVVAMIPGRIYSGCVSDTNPLEFSQFDSAFVMAHPFPDAFSPESCENVKPACELRSMLFQHKILYQQKDCCCDGEMCALLVFTQTNSLLPLILKTIDLSKETLIPLPTESTTTETVTTTVETTRRREPVTLNAGLFGG
ncbi:hypothetical protein GCK72_008937 [Caenorhabditis remanei]|uniref:Uncharacterized protein n=1 Tax=Caenorhabditis remanei TaxID=31234 RepID=A0A6A5GYX7_CAERE|nr:hypothetical protein GCK72_008937 [Caenorhabditis remanei]KAF1760688.1 hypothetical protein GCK72_008937 [Caenorhabditis remanei]